MPRAGKGSAGAPGRAPAGHQLSRRPAALHFSLRKNANSQIPTSQANTVLTDLCSTLSLNVSVAMADSHSVLRRRLLEKESLPLLS